MAARSAEAVAVIAAADEGVLSSRTVAVVDAFAGNVEFRDIELELEFDGDEVEGAAAAAEVMVELFDDDSVAF